MAHTPGPWTARNQKSIDGKDLGWIIEVNEGRRGRIGWSSRAFADTNKEEDRGGPEAAANALLIAAAPELLEALEDAYEVIGADCTDTLHLIEAAISKATGGAE